MTMMGEIAMASYEQRSEIMGLNKVPVDKIREAFVKIEQKYRQIYQDITDKYLNGTGAQCNGNSAD